MAGREKNCKWFFADQPIGQEVGPNNAMAQNFKQHPYASLIRESIQNSLDAVLDKSKPVEMVFSFNELSGMEFPAFFDLQKHIKGCLDYYPNNANAKAIYEPMLRQFDGNRYHERIGYIRVSDYNTCGMDYDEDKTDSPFYAFVRSAGVSSKTNDSAGGSFGFGKAAYYLLSPISTIIVSTQTQDGNMFFEGISSLCTHKYGDAKKVNVGYYDDQNGHPIKNEEDIPVPFRREESGTDITILGFNLRNKQEAVKEMLEAVIRNFWLAIHDNKLEVTIANVSVNHDNLDYIMSTYLPDEEDNTKRFGFYYPRPYYDAVTLAGQDSRCLHVEKILPILGKVHLYLKKQKNVADKILYMRAPKMLVYGKKNKSSYGIYGVFLCSSQQGNDILRELENPAHDEWKAANWTKEGRTVVKGREALQELDDFIDNTLKELFVQKDQTVVNIKGLEEFLYIPTEYDEDSDSDNEALTGMPTGKLKDDGNSPTTDIPDSTPNTSAAGSEPSTGHIMINRTANATNVSGGSLRSGHGQAKKKPNAKGIQKPGDAKDVRTEDENGEKGLFATPIYVPYRTFSQVENNITYHYVVLHSSEEVGNVRLHFYAVGEERDEELIVTETNVGNVSGSIVRDIHLSLGTTRLRVRFSDNMKHSVKLSAEELHEL